MNIPAPACAGTAAESGSPCPSLRTGAESRPGPSRRSVAYASIAAGERHLERVLVMTTHDHPRHLSDHPTRRSALGLGTTALGFGAGALGSAALLGAGTGPAHGAPAAPTSPTGPSSPAASGIAPNPALVRTSDGPLTFFARTTGGAMISGRRTAPDSTDWSLQHHAVGIIDDVAAVARAGRGLRAVARSEHRIVVVTETADGSDSFDVLVHEVLPESVPALSTQGLFVLAGGAVQLLDPTTGEMTELGGPAEGTLATALEHRLHGDDAVTVAAGPEGTVVVRRLEGQWSAVVADRALSTPRVSTYSMRGGVTSWVVGLDDGVLIAADISDPAEETPQWQELVTGVSGLPAVSESMTVLNLFATVHEDGELRVTTLSPELRTRVARTGAVGDPSLGALTTAGAIQVFSLGAEDTLWVSQLDDTGGEAESVQLARGIAGRASAAVDEEGRKVFAVTRTDGDLLVGTKLGPSVGDWELEVVDTAL